MPLALSLTPSTLAGFPPQAFSFVASASGGTAPYTYAATSSDTGIAVVTIDSSTGVGTVTLVAAGTCTVSVTVTDSASAVETAPLTVVVTPAALGIRQQNSFYRHSLTPLGKQPAHELLLNLPTGNLIYAATDFRWQARIRPGISRYCNSYATRVGQLGRGWNFTYDEGLEGELPFEVPPSGSVDYDVTYRDLTGRVSEPFTVTVTDTGSMSVTPGSIADFLQLIPLEDLRLGIVDKSGFRREFNPDGTLHAFQDRNGNRLVVNYDGSQIASVSTPVSGEDYPLIDTFEYTGDVITRIGDSKTQTFWQYAYAFHPVTDDPYLTRVTDPMGHTWDYSYGWQEPETVFHEAMIEVTDPNGGVTRLAYDGGELRLGTLIDAEAGTRTFAYAESSGAVTTTVSDPNGEDWIYEHDTDLCLVRLVDPLTNETLYTYTTDSGVQVIASIQDARGSSFTTLFEDYDGLGNPGKITNALSEVTTFAYNGFSQVTSRVDALSAETQYDYDTRGNLIQETSSLGYVKEWEYAENGDLLRTFSAQQVIDGKDAWTAFVYDPIYGVAVKTLDSAGHVRVSVFEPLRRWVNRAIDPLGQTATFGHDPLGHMTSAIDPLGRVSSWSFDRIGNLLEEVSATGAATTYGFDRLNRLIAVSNALGATTHTSFDPNGNELTITDPLGNTTTYEYDEANRVTSATSPLGQVTYMEYDEVGNLTRVIRPVIVDLFRWHDREYDALNRIVVSTQSGSIISVPAPGTEPAVLAAALAGGLLTVDSLTREYEFDAVGRQTATVDPRGNRTETVYDSDGRAIQVINALEQNAYTVYDADGRVLEQFNTGVDPDTDPASMEYRYDGIGRKISQTDAAGAVTTYEYDALGREVVRIDPASQAWLTEYDAIGRVVKTTNPLGAERTYGYDDGRLERSVTDPLGNTSTTRFDLLGRRVEAISPRGYVSRYAYDPRNRLIEQTEPNGARQTRAYDAGGRLTETTDVYNAITAFAYDTGNRLTDMTDPLSQVTSYTYDTLDRLIQITLPSGDIVETTYDENGNHLTETDAATDTTTFVYDELNRVTSRTDSSSQEWLYDYDVRGRLTQVTEPNLILLDFGYDQVGRRTRMQKTIPASLLPGDDDWVEVMRWSYDLRGNVTSFMDQNGNAWQYGYDPASRLIAWDDPMSTPFDPRRGTVQYDLAGRIVSRQDPVGQLVSYDYNSENKLTDVRYPDGQAVHYDWTCCRVSGMQDQFGGSKLVYDLKHRLLAQAGQGYLTGYNYDILGRRTRMLSPGESEYLYEYTPRNSVERLAQNSPDLPGSQVTRLTYFTGGMVETVEAVNGNVYSFGYDASSHAKLSDVTISGVASATAAYSPATGELVGGVQNIESFWDDTYVSDFMTRGDGVVLQENHGSTPAPSNLTDYTYDHIGNMLRRTNDVTAIGTDFAYNPASQLIGFESFPVSTPPESISVSLPHNVITDRNSNIKRITLDAGDSWIECRYDADNRLVEVVYPEGGPVIELAYDGLNRCVRTRVNGAGVVHVCDGLQRIQDRDERTGDLLAEYTYVQGQLHKWRTSSTEHWVFIEPQGGWPRHLFDDAGVLTDSFDFDWNGQELLHQGTTEAPIGWGGGWKLASDTDLPLLLMPGTNEVWSPTLGKSLNPLASMSQALPYATAVGGYTGEVIGLPVRLPVIPSWGSAPGYPWWPGQSGPMGGSPRMQDGGALPSIDPVEGFTSPIIPFVPPTTPQNCPPPPNWQTPCNCCQGNPAQSETGGEPPCWEIINYPSAYWGTYDPSRPLAPVGPQEPCYECFGRALKIAQNRLPKLANCLPSTLWTCISNEMQIAGTPSGAAAYCMWASDTWKNTLACTTCALQRFGKLGIFLNCSLGRSHESLASSLVHEFIHWCYKCKQGPGNCTKEIWEGIQNCMVYLCSYNCPGLVTPGAHKRDCESLLTVCTALVVGCGWWSCNAYVYRTSSGYAVRIWGAPWIHVVPFDCQLFYTGLKGLGPDFSSGRSSGVGAGS